MTDDATLLREFAGRNSEEAFAALVSRHVNLVYSVALRRVRDPHLAEEITQAVFIILARKAKSLGPKTILTGWLCRTARYVSANALTTQRRRQRREQEAYMQSTLNELEPETWKHIAPLLDDAMARLGQKDHDALVLRFFENKSFGEVGAAIGASEDTARMRVNRALEKLRQLFSKRGVNSTAATIAGTISANSIQAAPVALAKSVTAVALGQRRNGFRFNLNPHQRSIENYGMDKSENGNRGWSHGNCPDIRRRLFRLLLPKSSETAGKNKITGRQRHSDDIQRFRLCGCFGIRRQPLELGRGTYRLAGFGFRKHFQYGFLAAHWK